MTVPFELSVVRIYSNNGQVAGAGFLVSQKHILTCAHVVANALSLAGTIVEKPEQSISLDFPIVAAKKLFKAKVVFWRPVNPNEFAEDIAGLELETAPPDTAQPAQLVFAENVWRHPFRVLGFPRNQYDGAWASGELRAGISNGWVQLEDIKQQGYALEQGFSGAPIWNEHLQGIAGMAVAAEMNRLETKAAFMIPTKVLCEAWSELSSIVHSETCTEREFPIFDQNLYSSCYKEIKKSGALLRVKAPLHWGKTYLIKEILDYATQQGYQAVRVDLKQAEKKDFDSLTGFLEWFCFYISWKLNVEERINKYWQSSLPPKIKCTNYFQKYLLQENQTPLVLALDDVDLLFPYKSIAHEFFSMLRSWHEDAKSYPIWQKLRLLLAYSKEDFVPLHNHQSPFNVGIAIQLSELTLIQVQNLAQRYQLDWSERQVNRFMAMVDGHPYLVRLGLDRIGRKELTLEQFLKIAPTEEGLYCNHLLSHLSRLKENSELEAAIRQVVSDHSPVNLDSTEASKLVNMGLVKRKANGVVPFCELYRLYFSARLRVN
ncbi:trypsin-like serine protease [Scytonema sp. UIC 10036]|uniref:AAA-like domain-containing protein n=1 Tax=Scytonema sp. UIC 10036 TaxID=2304196 RepID=UPI0012DA023C|nr:AAA-like domain-containing protein [Scytonema sp. UIC 10036]MUG92675.1 trypsin-like serine protease [Scytonema sp. UIC 10036]